MKNAEIFVLSKHLSLESLDTDTGIRVIINTLTGQCLQMTPESMKILDVFQSPHTLRSASKYLGISGRGSYHLFCKSVSPLINMSFLISTTGVQTHELV